MKGVKILRELLEVLTHSRLWVASMITCLAAFSATSLSLRLHALPLALVFFCALGIYNVDHVVDLPRERARSARVLALLSLASVLALLTRASAELVAVVVAGACLSLGYFLPIRVGERRVRLETLPVMKPLLIGCAVASASLFVPLVHAATSEGAGPAALERRLPEAVFRTCVLALLCGANSLVFDVRDAASDRARGIATAPTARGVRFTRVLISILLLLSVAAAELGFRSGVTAAFDVRRAIQAAALCTLFCTWALPTRAARPVWALCVDGILAVPLLWTLFLQRP